MKLTEKDKNALLKTALQAKDVDSLRDWVVSLVDAVDKAEQEEGKSDVSVTVPRYAPLATPTGNGHPARIYQEPSLL